MSAQMPGEPRTGSGPGDSPAGFAGLAANLARNAFAGALTILTWLVVGIWVARTQGVETWGLLSLFATAQALASSLEFGMSLYVTRRVARSTNRWPLRMLGAAETHAILQAVGVALVGIVLVACHAGSWLSADRLDAALRDRAVGWLALTVALGWPATFYRAILAGLSSQVAFARSLAYFGATKIVVVIPVLAVTDSLDAAFAAMCIVASVETATSRRLAVANTASFSWSRVSRGAVWRLFRRNLKVGSPATLVGINGSLDKLVIASTLDLRIAALYNSAWMLASAVSWTLQPIIQSLYPRICRAAHDPGELWRENRLLFTAIAVIVVPAACIALGASGVLARVWFSDADSRSLFLYFVFMLMIGTAINSQTIMSWYVGLASDDSHRNLHVGLAAVAFTAVVFPILLARAGFVFAPAAWLFINVLGLLYPGLALAIRLRRVMASLSMNVTVIAVVATAALLLLPGSWDAVRQVLHR
jgi:O-antigen/teichoic acid export membrane protein